jgi:hypothetical protein
MAICDEEGLCLHFSRRACQVEFRRHLLPDGFVGCLQHQRRKSFHLGPA